MKKLIFSIVFLTAFFSFGQSYNLDPTFGSGGKAIVASVPQSPIKVYFENNTYFLINSSNSMSSINYDGSMNTGFGTNGVVTFNGANETFYTKGSKFVNGYFYVFGQISNSSSSISKDLFLVKISSSGVLDISFGVNGMMRQDFGSDELLNDILLLPDGRIMGIGTRLNAAIITKYNANGTMDSLFDPSGYKTPLPSTSGSTNTGSNLFEFEGNILAVGKSYFNENSGTFLHNDLLLFKIDSNGTPITSFGTNGFKKSPLAGTSNVGSFSVSKAQLVNNEIYFAEYYGFSFTTQYYTLRKYNFTTDAVSSIGSLPYNNSIFVFDANQKIYVSGSERCSPPTSTNCRRDFTLFRQNTNGTLDTTFNNNTYQYSYDFFPADLVSDDQCSAFYLHDDGRIFLAGGAYNPFSTNGSGLGMLRIVDGPLSIDDSQILKPTVTNPVYEELIIEAGNYEIKGIKIFDLLGKQVAASENTGKINVSFLPKGIYITKIKIDGVDYSVKMIKK